VYRLTIDYLTHSILDMRYGFFISVLMTYGMIIGPACFRTWIFKGTGNANFFYFITLLFLLAQVLLLVEFVYAQLKERYEEKKKVQEEQQQLQQLQQEQTAQ
jgi:Na+/melibiose symporter-like transporter